MWIEPKTDWVSTDYINYTDYNRIKNNIEYLMDLSSKIYMNIPFKDMGNDKASYADFPYADEFNNLEENIDNIKRYTFAFDSSERKTWYENQRTPTYEDLNRLEQACLNLYEGLNSQLSIKSHLSITLGRNVSTIKC